MLINYISFKLNMNVLYQRKIIDKCRKTSNFNLGFPKFADRGKPSWGRNHPQTRSFSLLLHFALIAHFCYSFFLFLAFFKIEETLRKIFWKNFKKLRSTLWRVIRHFHYFVLYITFFKNHMCAPPQKKANGFVIFLILVDSVFWFCFRNPCGRSENRVP